MSPTPSRQSWSVAIVGVCLVGTMGVPRRQDDGPATIAGAVRGWEALTRVEVTPDAEASLARQVTKLGPGERLITAVPTKGHDAFTSMVLTRGYLTWLRDKRVGGQRRADPLTTGDVSDKTISSYLQGVGALGITLGELVVTSKPPEASITIDDLPKGLTDGTFAMSPGLHKVVVAPAGRPPCTRSVLVTAGNSERVDCT